MKGYLNWEVDLVAQVVAAGPENLLDNPWVEEEGGAQVERIAPGTVGAGATAHMRLPFQDSHIQPGAGQKHGGCQATRPGTHDHDARHRLDSRGTGFECQDINHSHW